MLEQVYVTFDVICGTWNVMSADNECLFYGAVLAVEQWLVDNSDSYYEED